MIFWVVESGEPLPVDEGYRPLRCSTLCERLSEAGHQVLWWANTFDHARKRHRFDRPVTLSAKNGLTLHLLHGSAYSRNLSLRRLLHNRQIAAEFARDSMRRQPRPDLIFCCMPTPELAEKSVQFGRGHRVPVVVDIRDLWPDSYLSFAPEYLKRVGRIALRSEFRRMRRICEGATALTAVSESFLRWGLERSGRARSPLDCVFPLGYPPLQKLTEGQFACLSKRLRDEYSLSADAFVVTFIGVFGASYDLGTVVEAARLIERQNPKVHFILAGDGDQADAVRRQARGLSNVTLTGWLGQENIRALLAISSAGLACYVECAPQSLPNKPYEYMAAGLPIVSSLLGELQKLIEIEEVGVHYQAGDPRALAKAVDFLERTPQARKAMETRARRIFHDRFSSEIVYDAFARHLERACVQSARDMP